MNRQRFHLSFIIVLTLLLSIRPAFAQDDFPPRFPGTIEGTGTYFEVTDSEYLNLTLDSSELVHLSLESDTEIVVIALRAADGATSTNITLSGFEPLTDYYKYENDFHNEVMFTTDANGSYTYEQDLNGLNLIVIKQDPSTYFIRDNLSGGDCQSKSIGTWDPNTKTCTLTANVNQLIQIDSNGITLDGNGHTLTSSVSNYGVVVWHRTGVTVKNLIIRNSNTGIYLWYSSGSTIVNNQITGVLSIPDYGTGILVRSSNDNIVEANDVTETRHGIWVMNQQDTVVGSSNNVIRYNTIFNNWTGLSIASWGRTVLINNNEVYNNNFIDNTPYQAFHGHYGVNNIFNKLLPIGGNYWSNYDEPTEGCSDSDYDNFCDAPYEFPYRQDNLPWKQENGWDIQSSDADGDGVPDADDNAPDGYNPDQSDIDLDGVGDVADPCPSDPADLCDQEGSAAQSIGSQGGNISTPNGSVDITIPQGALGSDTSISITDMGTGFELGSSIGKGLPIFGVVMGPTGTSFEPYEVTIVFSWEDGDDNGRVDGFNIKEDKLQIFKNDVPITNTCSNDPGCDMTENTFTFTVSSFSEFVLGFVDLEGPVVQSLTAVPNPVAVGQEVAVSAVVDDTDMGDSNIASAQYSLDGGTIWDDMSLDSGVEPQTATASVTFPCPETGIYNLCVRGWDEYENFPGDPECIFLPVYDPEGGFVTGGGWIWSPVGAYKADPALEGKANFGFVSKYKKGATVPTGETEFQFKAGSLNFHSASYDWLVIAGAKAKYKGVGTINGSGSYGFMLSAIDAALTPSTDVDLFRIKIWDKDDGDAVVYDNQLDAAEDADPTTAIGGGSIVIHKSKSK